MGGGSSVYSSTPNFGLRSSESTGYNISYNNFNYSPSATTSPFGVVIYNSGENNNFIFKNIFNDMTTAQFICGVNRSNDPQKKWDGLKLICNEHYNSIRDIDIQLDFLSSSHQSLHGIAMLQGIVDPLGSAGNIFSQPANSLFGHMINGTPNPITYVHSGGITEPINISAGINTVLGNSISCSRGPTRIPLSLSERNQLYTELNLAESALENLNFTYAQLIDGGNTENLIQTIESTWSQDVLNLRSEMIQKSPYISHDALEKAADKTIIHHAIILEICLANPEITKSEYFMEYLKNEIQNPLPQYMIDIIKSNRDQHSLRANLEWSIANFYSDRSYTIDLLIQDLMVDSIVQVETIRDLLINLSSV